MIKSLFSFMFAALMWVQVPQWSDDWSKCSVDVPDTGLQDIGELHDTMASIQKSSEL